MLRLRPKIRRAIRRASVVPLPPHINEGVKKGFCDQIRCCSTNCHGCHVRFGRRNKHRLGHIVQHIVAVNTYQHIKWVAILYSTAVPYESPPLRKGGARSMSFTMLVKLPLSPKQMRTTLKSTKEPVTITAGTTEAKDCGAAMFGSSERSCVRCFCPKAVRTLPLQ